MSSKDQLSNDLLKYVQNVIDGNQVRGDELKLIDSQVEKFNLKIEVSWKFYAKWNDRRVAGGNKSNNHFGYNEKGFDQHHSINLNTAKSDKSIRYNFIQNIKNQQIQSLLNSSQKCTVQDLGTHSFIYDCGTCNGRGNVTCYLCRGSLNIQCDRCYGSGSIQERYTIHDYKTNTVIPSTRWVSCGRCFGRGNITCTRCNGTGSESCSNCSGYGYFTFYRSTVAVAEPNATYTVNSNLYQEEILDFLLNQNYNFCLKKITFTAFESSSPYANVEKFIYYGNSWVTEITTDLRNTVYKTVAISNPPHPFLFPPIFDQLFKEEIAELQKIGTFAGKQQTQMAIKFFDHFKGQPVLDQSLKNIAKIRTSSDGDYSEAVRQACNYFISREASQDFSKAINVILDKVSPPYHNLTWLIWHFFTAIMAFFLVEFAVEHARIHGFWEMLLYGLYCIVGFYIFYCISSLFIIVISSLINAYKRRNVPNVYRQKMRHKEVFWESTLLGILAVFIGGAYGLLALNNYAPKMNYQPFLWINQQFSSSNEANPIKYICDLYPKNLGAYYPPICDEIYQSVTEKILPSIDNTNKLLDAQNEGMLYRRKKDKVKISFIQAILRRDYPAMKINGKWDSNTEETAKEWLKNNGYPIADNANKYEIFLAFNLVEKK